MIIERFSFNYTTSIATRGGWGSKKLLGRLGGGGGGGGGPLLLNHTERNCSTIVDNAGAYSSR